MFRILWEMNNIGLLEGTANGTHHDANSTPYVPPRPDLDSAQAAASFAAAQSIAEDSATLLKNDGAALPLSAGDLAGKGTVVMGPTAIAPYIDGGGSSHVTPYDPAQSPYDALTQKAAAGAKLGYVPGYDLDGQLVPSSALTAPDPAENYANWTLNAGRRGVRRPERPAAPADHHGDRGVRRAARRAVRRRAPTSSTRPVELHGRRTRCRPAPAGAGRG